MSPQASRPLASAQFPAMAAVCANQYTVSRNRPTGRSAARLRRRSRPRGTSRPRLGCARCADRMAEHVKVVAAWVMPRLRLFQLPRYRPPRPHIPARASPPAAFGADDSTKRCWHCTVLRRTLLTIVLAVVIATGLTLVSHALGDRLLGYTTHLGANWRPGGPLDRTVGRRHRHERCAGRAGLRVAVRPGPDSRPRTLDSNVLARVNQSN